jgi:hypothetical protein
MPKKRKVYNPEIVKIEWYVGYGDAGRVRKKRIQTNAKSKGYKTTTDMIEQSVKSKHPDIDA